MAPVSGSRASKRLHKKSRRGCSRCKLRRVKCDEQAPCNNCARRHEECDLQIPEDLRKCSKCPTCVGHISSLEWGLEAYLMHYYTIATSNTIMKVEATMPLFRLWIPEAAISQPYLTRGIMSIAAFHLAFERPCDRGPWLELAFKNQTSASSALRRSLGKMNAENAAAVFALSLLLGVTAIAATSLSAIAGMERKALLADVLENFALLRSTKLLSFSMAQISSTSTSHFTPMLLGYRVIEQCQEELLPDSIKNQFASIRSVVGQTSATPQIASTLFDTIELLENIYREVVYTGGTANNNVCMIWKFTNIVSSAYDNLLKDAEPNALVILGHWALLNHATKDHWYLRYWAAEAIRAVKLNVEDPWRELLSWPEEQLRNDMAAFKSSVYNSSISEVVGDTPTILSELERFMSSPSGRELTSPFTSSTPAFTISSDDDDKGIDLEISS